MRGKTTLISTTICFLCARRQHRHRSFPTTRLGIEKNVLLSETDKDIPSSAPNDIPLSLLGNNLENSSTIIAATTTSSVLLLNVVAVVWGSQHAVIKQVMESSDASTFTLLRFGLAALLAAPFTPGLSLLFNPQENATVDNNDNTKLKKKEIAQTWRWGLEMGFWMFLGFSFQAIGLESTTAQKSGFLLYLNVKFVPFLAFLLLGREIRLQTLISALVAFTGTALLATENNGLESFNAGDAWSVAAAAASAMFILRLERASAQVANVAQFNSASLWVVASLSALWTFSHVPLDERFGNALWQTATEHGWEIVYLGGVATALTNWIQSKAQKGISAERAAVIYAMDPVYGAFFSSWLLGESLGGPQAWLGAGMITLAAATNTLLDFPEREDRPNER